MNKDLLMLIVCIGAFIGLIIILVIAHSGNDDNMPGMEK